MAKPLKELKLEGILSTVVSDSFLKKLAEEAIKNLRTRARLGYAVAKDGGPQGKFKPLAPSTIKRRQYSSKLSDSTAPKRSNLTDSGKLLDSISYRIVGQRIEIFLEGERNQKVAEYVSPDRPFFHLSATEVSRLVDMIETAIDSYIQQRN